MKSVLISLVLLGSGCLAAFADTPIIAISSNMAFAAEEIRARFHEHTGKSIKFSIGSSGILTRQIMQGAPFQVFLSADSSYTKRLFDANKTQLAPEPYAKGKLCLFIPKESKLNQVDSLSSIISKLSHGHFTRLTIANPELAPYGRASITALQRVGIWAFDRSKLILGENVSQATQFTLTGSVDVGLIPMSHALRVNVKNKGRCFQIPEYWHEPIIQEMALLNNAKQTALQFYNFMKSTHARIILNNYGYAVPD